MLPLGGYLQTQITVLYYFSFEQENEQQTCVLLLLVFLFLKTYIYPLLINKLVLGIFSSHFKTHKVIRTKLANTTGQ